MLTGFNKFYLGVVTPINILNKFNFYFQSLNLKIIKMVAIIMKK
jgi:hypothetical protein